MSRYAGYYKQKNAIASDDVDKGKIVKASTSRENLFYEEPAVTLAKWRKQMQEVFSVEKMAEFNTVRSKEDFDNWMVKYGITNPR